MKNEAIAISVMLELLKQAVAISTLVQRAQSENRDLTTEELTAAVTRDDSARGALVNAISSAEAQGR